MQRSMLQDASATYPPGLPSLNHERIHCQGMGTLETQTLETLETPET